MEHTRRTRLCARPPDLMDRCGGAGVASRVICEPGRGEPTATPALITIVTSGTSLSSSPTFWADGQPGEAARPFDAAGDARLWAYGHHE